MHRRRFDENGKIINTLEDFPEAMRQVAKDENVALIDLNNMSKTLWETLGVENSKKLLFIMRLIVFRIKKKRFMTTHTLAIMVHTNWQNVS
jgi:hypothetical protein